MGNTNGGGPEAYRKERVISASRYSRPLESEYNAVGLRHEGVVLNTDKGKNYLLHHPGSNGKGGRTTITPASNMSKKWEKEYDIPVKGTPTVQEIFNSAGGRTNNSIINYITAGTCKGAANGAERALKKENNELKQLAIVGGGVGALAILILGYQFFRTDQKQSPKIYKYINLSSEEQENKINHIITQLACQDLEWVLVLKEIKKSAMNLLEAKPQIFLFSNQHNFIELNREQVSGFLSLMFFNLTISQQTQQQEQEFNPQQNLFHLRHQIFCKFQKQLSQNNVKISKIKLQSKSIDGWMSSQAPLASIEFTNNSKLNYKNKTVLDFANAQIEGLVLDDRNCDQEEILMLLHQTEAIVASLFFSKLEEDEVIYFENVLTEQEEQFKYCKIVDYQPKVKNILAVDTYQFSNEDQFEKKWILRELNKAFVGFEKAKHSNRDIVSGMWGCGISGRNVELKLIIQIVAFSLSQLIIDTKTKLILNDPQSEQIKQSLTDKLSQFKTVGALIKSVME